FFFSSRRRHTRCLSDWSSDVCSSDLSVFGHWGPPMIVFPTSGGDEWECERQSMIAALGDAIEGGRVKLYCVNTNHGDSFANRGRSEERRVGKECRARRWVCR